MTGNKFSFTLKRLNEISKTGNYYDTHQKANGLFYEVRTDGNNGSFKVKGRINGKQVKVTLGKHPALTIEQARRKASEVQADFNNGINPNTRKQFQRCKQATLAEFFNTYLNAKNLKPKTINGYKVSFKNVLSPLASKQITDITYDDILKTHQEYSKRSTAEADRAMRLLRAIFYMAMDELKDLNGHPLINENPVRKLSKNKHFTKLERKTRKIEDDQIKPFLECITEISMDNRPFYQTGADLILMLFFHGTRFTEMANLKWCQVDFKYKRFYLDETKNGRRLWLPMTTESEKALKRRKRLSTGGDYVFPSATDNNKSIADVKKPLRHLLEETGIQITPHDLRRTFLGMGSRLGFSDYLLKQLANHTLGNDVTAGYVIQSADELREPSQKITNAFLEKAGRTIANTDSRINDLLNGLSEADKQRLIIQLSKKTTAV
jgi:integrase